MNSDENKKIISDLLSILNTKARYFWEAKGKLELVLKAELDTGSGPNIVAPDAHVVYPIQEWCLENNCGRRMSYDTFRFRNQKQKTLFLLRWEGVSDDHQF